VVFFRGTSWYACSRWLYGISWLVRFERRPFSGRGAVRLKDVVQIVHPRPDTPERADLYRRILDGQLRTPDTWKVRISTQGSTREAWNEAAPHMGKGRVCGISGPAVV